MLRVAIRLFLPLVQQRLPEARVWHPIAVFHSMLAK
jgi:hypothetical protein